MNDWIIENLSHIRAEAEGGQKETPTISLSATRRPEDMVSQVIFPLILQYQRKVTVTFHRGVSKSEFIIQWPEMEV